MDATLKLWFNDGHGDYGFPYNMEQAELGDFAVSATRMGNAPTITATLEYPTCLDDEWERYCHFDDVFVVFKNERYYLKAIPTSSKSNDKLFYKHELGFVAERSVLETVYMIDDNENQTANILYSNNTQYTFFGSIQDFAERINQSMYFSGIGDTCMYLNGVIVPVGLRQLTGDGFYVYVDASVANTDEVLVTLSNNTVAEALKQVFEQWNVPYYFVGREIHIGEYEVLTETTPAYVGKGILGAGLNSGALVPYEYGYPNSLLNVTRSNNTKQVYNRVSGTGSEDNIPYYYPNPTPSGTIHHEVTAATGGTLTDSDVIVDDYVKFSRLGDTEALVYFDRQNSVWESVGAKQFYFDGHLVLFINGTLTNQSVTFPYTTTYDSQTGSYTYYLHPKQVTIIVKMNFTKQYSQLHFDFSNEFLNGTDWTLYSADSSVYLQGSGTTVDYNGSTLPLGVYYIAFNKTYTPSHTGGLNAYDFNRYKTESVSIANLVSDASNWNGVHEYSSTYWSLLSSGNSVRLVDYGLSIADGATLTDGDKIEKVIDKWVVPQPKLMPSCYRLSDGTKRFYPARNYPMQNVSGNNYDIDADLGDEVVSNTLENDNYKDASNNYYQFANLYRRLKQREHIEDFPDIKPTIEGMINGDGERIDMFRGIAFDTNDSNDGDYDENGNFKYNHPYFFVQLQKMDFNLFAHAIDESEMTIAMTSGDCAPCEFKIMVNKDTGRNMVQYTNQLLRDDEGDVICGRKGEAIDTLDSQNDTLNNRVWVALEKNTEAFGEIMPYNNTNTGVQIRPKACTNVNTNDGDTFVILHINLPQAYVTAAEQRLTEAIIKWMYDNNSQKFNMSLKYSRAYLGGNQSVIDLLSENVKVSVRYNGITKQYFVSSYSYKKTSSNPMPEIEIGGLVETVEELKSVASAGKGLTNKIASEISEKFGEMMMGTGKPLTRIIQQNNTTVANQIKGDFPTDYVQTTDVLFDSQIIVGTGNKTVKSMYKGEDGQVLKMENGVITWGDGAASIEWGEF